MVSGITGVGISILSVEDVPVLRAVQGFPDALRGEVRKSSIPCIRARSSYGSNGVCRLLTGNRVGTPS